jgi:hypothetical protein
MGGLLVLTGWMTGTGPAETLGRFDPANNGAPVVGGLLHLAVSGIYGAIFAIALRFLANSPAGLADRALWPVGAAYGMILWLVAHLVLLPGMNSHLRLISPAQFAVNAHVAYGLALGYLLGRGISPHRLLPIITLTILFSVKEPNHMGDLETIEILRRKTGSL